MRPRVDPGGTVRIHVINPPDQMSEYMIRPADLRRRLADLAEEKGLAVEATESEDPSVVTPEMRQANILVGYLLPYRQVSELPALSWIHLTSAGADHLLPLDWLPAQVTLTNSSGVHAEQAGEYA